MRESFLGNILKHNLIPIVSKEQTMNYYVPRNLYTFKNMVCLNSMFENKQLIGSTILHKRLFL